MSRKLCNKVLMVGISARCNYKRVSFPNKLFYDYFSHNRKEVTVFVIRKKEIHLFS